MPKVDIKIVDILKYINGRDRPLKEGEEVLKAGHIIMCGIKSNSLCSVNSLCLQTSALSSPPHEIQITLAENVMNWKCVCTCKAGQSGFCKHVVATLLYINRHEELDVLSCTDLTQAWGKEKTGISKIYEETMINQFWCHKPKKEKLKSDVAIDKQNFEPLMLCKQSSALFKFVERSKQEENVSRPVSRVTSLPDVAQTYYSQILDGANNSEFLESITIDWSTIKLETCCLNLLSNLGKFDQQKFATCQQKSSEWKEARKLRITGSRCYQIYTYSVESNWQKKAMEYFFPKPFFTKATNHGIKYESEALDCYKHSHQVEIISLGLIICRRFPWLAFSPDGIVVTEGKPSILLEIKCPYIGMSVGANDFVNTCDYLSVQNNQIILKKKHIYYGQIQLGMALLNLHKTHLVIYSPHSKSFLQLYISFDKEFAKNLIEVISYKYLCKMMHVYCQNVSE